MSQTQRLMGKLVMETAQGNFLGEPRIRLLEAIAELGSISKAAKVVPLSYKSAWEAVDTINNLSESLVVERVVGGRDGGGARLTEHGRRLVAMYRAMATESQRLLDRLTAVLGEDGPADLGQFQSLLRRMTMHVSARNQFVGPVTKVREGAVNTEVHLKLDDQYELVAQITRESAENLGIKVGGEVMALIKASSVVLMTESNIRVSARNQLWGEVFAIQEGAVNSEVSVALPSGRIVTAIITDDSVERLGLKLGSAVCAMFKASSILLATFE